MGGTICEKYRCSLYHLPFQSRREAITPPPPPPTTPPSHTPPPTQSSTPPNPVDFRIPPPLPPPPPPKIPDTQTNLMMELIKDLQTQMKELREERKQDRDSTTFIIL